MWHDPDVRPVYDETISFDLSTEKLSQRELCGRQ